MFTMYAHTLTCTQIHSMHTHTVAKIPSQAKLEFRARQSFLFSRIFNSPTSHSSSYVLMQNCCFLGIYIHFSALNTL